KSGARPPPTSLTERTSSRPSSGSSGGKLGAIAAIGLLAVVIGVGVLGQALDKGWFFMDMLTGPSGEPAPKQVKPSVELGPDERLPGDPATPAVQTRRAIADVPAAYVARIAESKGQLQQSPDDPRLTRDVLGYMLRYRFRWPGRYSRDEAMRAELDTLLKAAGKLSIEAEFFELLGGAPKKGETRADRLARAEVVISQLDPRRLPSKRDLLYKALLFEARGKIDNALGLLSLVVRDVPDDQWALFEGARLQLKQERLDDADATIDALLRLAPNHFDGILLAAEVAVGRQTPDSYARARKLAERAHTMATEANDAYGEYRSNLMRAVVYGLQNDLGRRLEALEGAAQYDPRDETLLLELAENDLKSGAADKAAERLKSCADGVCNSIRYFKTHIKVLYTDHQLVAAEKLVREADKAHPDEPELLFWGAKVLEARGKLTLAERKYDLVREKDPRYLEAYLRVAGIARREKDFDKAIRVLDEAAKVFEGAGKDSAAGMALLQERGELLVKQGRMEQAREVFSKIVAAQPNNAPARMRLAVLLTDLGYPQKAVPHFEKLYQQGRSGPEVYIKFAKALIGSGQPDRAIEELKIFLEHNPKNLEGLVNLGHAYVQRQRYEEAMATLEHAVAINQNYAPAYYFAGLAELGRQRQKAEEVERQLRNGEVVKDENKADFTRAIIALTSAKDKDPEHLGYRRALAEALTESGRQRNLLAALEQYDFILAAYRKAMRLGRPMKRTAEVYFNRGLLASKLGRPRAEVLQNFGDALVLDGERADFIARYAEELYRLQSQRKVGERYVLEAKAYFELVLEQHNAKHVRANYYMGKIALREWDRQRGKKPGDTLHMKAYDYFQQVVKNEGDKEFPDAYLEMGHVLRDRGIYRLSDEQFKNYLQTYRTIHRRDPRNSRYVRDLMRR
ncbi:MAG: tetratricopeptide (TPR) repeat protein, partial [Myxococcota bacterium]